MKLLVCSFFGALVLVGCSTPVTVYKDRHPVFAMERFFNGKLCAWGLVRGRSGEVNRKFVADIEAKANADQIVLDEQFLFNDGERQSRIWQFKRQGDSWSGSAGDVVGSAFGEIAGDTLHLEYQLEVKVDEEAIIISMDDWLHLIDDKTLMGSTNMSKWGLNVGRIDIAIIKQAAGDCSSLRDENLNGIQR